MFSPLLNDEFLKLDKNLFDPFDGKTVAVSGATGLVGSLVCKALLFANKTYKTNIKVLPIARSSCKVADCLEGWTCSGLEEPYICDLATIDANARIDANFYLHAGCITQSKIMVEHPVDVIRTSINGTDWLLRNCLRNQSRMVYVSSMEYYGSLPAGVVADETALGYLDLHNVRSCYPESKRMCECLCNSAASQFGVAVCSARLAQTFGAGILPGENRAFAQFARSAMNGDNVVLKTQGLSEGNYVNSIDCVNALLLLLAYGESGEAYNVTNEGSHCQIKDMAKTAIATLGISDSQKVVFDIDRSNSSGYAPDVQLFLDGSKLRGLGWEPRYSLKESFSQLGSYLVEQSLL